MTSYKQTTDGQDYTTGYVYNLSGALIEQTYPSGRKVKSTLDADGNLAQVHSLKSSSDIWRPYASNFVYTAAGAVSSMKLGNGRFENTAFNSRLQPTQIGLGSSATNQGLLKLNYDYGTTGNNGNVLSQTITVPTFGSNNGFVAVQTYSYDSLNRLKSATENIDGNPTPSWQQTYTFDRYGNRNFDEANTTTLPKECTESGNPVVCEAIRPIVNPSASAANNRLSSTGWQYDTAGNTTVDAEGRQFTYDAENKQVKVKDPQNQIVGEYFYNGDGLRIKKVVPGTGETTIFAYDASNRLVAEYSTVAAPQSPMVSYTTADHLGSPRILTDQNGTTISRRDFMPYGEEIPRSGYGQDSVREKFATYERDEESGLDYAKARYSRFSLGRFHSADRYYLLDPHTESTATKSHDIVFLKFFAQPQYLNRYIYTVNNPLKFVDIDGLHPGAAAVAVPLVKAAIVGATIGAVVGGAIEAGKQIYNHGEIVDKNAIYQSAGTGAVYGAFVGVAGPVGAALARPLAARVVLGGAGAGVAGTGVRYVSGQQTTTGDVLTDTMAGALGGGAGQVASKLPVLPARVYLPNTLITRAAERVPITRVSFDGQRGIWFNPYDVYGDSLFGNVVRSSTSSGFKWLKETKDENFRTEVLGYELYLDQ